MDRDRLIGVVCGLASGALWGLVFLAPKLVPEASPAMMAAGRYLAYGLLAAALIAPRWKTAVAGLDLAAWRGLVWLSLAGNIVYFCLLVVGVHLAGVAASALIVGMVPVAVILWGLKDPGATPLRKLAGPLGLAVLAVLLIGWEAMQREGAAAHDAGSVILGLLCAVAALAAWTAYAVGNSRWLDRLPQVGANDWSLLTGVVTGGLALLLVPVVLFVPGQGAAADFDLYRFLGVSLAVALGASIVGNALWNRASQALPLTLLGQMIVSETLFALIYGFVYEQRWPTVPEIVAAILMVASVLWCVRAHAPEAEPAVEGDR